MGGFGWFWMGNLLKNVQLIHGTTLFLLYINNIAIYADDTTLYSKCNQAFDLWQQLELASELEFDLRDTVEWGRK